MAITGGETHQHCHATMCRKYRLRDDKTPGHLRIIPCISVRFRLLGIPVEQACISLSCPDRWYVGSIDIPPQKPIPCNLCKPGVSLHILRATPQVSKTLGEIRSDKLGEEIDGIRVHIGRILDLPSEDILVDLHRRATIPEWREATEHLENKDSKGPPLLVSHTRCIR